MSLKDRLKSKKAAKLLSESGEYRISVAKVAKAVSNVKNPSDLGNIVKEFAKFLNSMDAKDTQIVFKGNFDLGQRTLLNCVLSSFIDDGIQEDEDYDDIDEVKSSSKLIRKRKSVKARLEETSEEE